ncbi:hypothetical protein [Listeria seeligeri]|uniref:hypothetical protein n=1 Tax=Listeria seeligeri TaxID=1640 RepID=UPI001944C40A|nr:hypothetical protein [Listeria seeligeri]MBM5675620.1 hypothetical protein [Listeria seeligeri]
MEIYISIDSAGYVDSYSYSEISPGKKIQIDENDLFFQRMFTCYKFIDEKLVYDEKKEREILLKKQIKDATPSSEKQLIETQMALADMYEQNNKMQQQIVRIQAELENLKKGKL